MEDQHHRGVFRCLVFGLEFVLGMIMPNATAAGFCIAPGETMRNGFQVAVGADKWCVTFIFRGLVVDSAGKYVAALIVTLLISFSIEALGFARKQFVRRCLSQQQPQQRDNHSSSEAAPVVASVWWLRYSQSAMYGLQMLLAYMAMLVVMMYETCMFVALIAGFMLGHAVFSVCLCDATRTVRAVRASEGGQSLLQPNRQAPTASGDIQDEATREVSVHSPCCGGSTL